MAVQQPKLHRPKANGQPLDYLRVMRLETQRGNGNKASPLSFESRIFIFFLSCLLIPPPQYSFFYLAMFGCEVATFSSLYDAILNNRPSSLKKIGEYMYRTNMQLGEGSFSRVFEGVNLQTQEKVAIKVIELCRLEGTQLSSLLYQEAEILRDMNHPRVVRCMKIMKSENNCYIIMELCNGDNLQKRIGSSRSLYRGCPALPEQLLERTIFDIYLGLKYLSESNIIHRDLKSANILLAKSGRAKITDFGFAIRAFSNFHARYFVGTPLYTAPEVFLQQKYGPKTDIWSFGIIIYEMIFGETPLDKSTTERQFLSSLLQPIQIDRNCCSLLAADNGLAELLEGCLEANNFQRWDIDKLSSCKYMRSLASRYSAEEPETKKNKPIPDGCKAAFRTLSALMGERSTEKDRRILNQKRSVSNRRNAGQLSLNISRIGEQKKVVIAKNRPHKFSPKYVPHNNPSRNSYASPSPLTPASKHSPSFTPASKHSPSPLTPGSKHLEITCLSAGKSFTKTAYNESCQASYFSLKQESLQTQFTCSESTQLTFRELRQQPCEVDPSHRLGTANINRRGQHSGNSAEHSREYFKISHLCIDYFEVVKLLHYSRLVYRVLSIPKYHIYTLQKWLLTLITCLREQLSIPKQLDWLKRTAPGLSKQNLDSLRRIVNKYSNKYWSFSTHKGKLEAVPFTELKIGINNLLVNNSTSEQKQMLLFLRNQTLLVIEAIERQTFKLFSHLTHCQNFLQHAPTNF